MCNWFSHYIEQVAHGQKEERKPGQSRHAAIDSGEKKENSMEHKTFWFMSFHLGQLTRQKAGHNNLTIHHVCWQCSFNGYSKISTVHFQYYVVRELFGIPLWSWNESVPNATTIFDKMRKKRFIPSVFFLLLLSKLSIIIPLRSDNLQDKLYVPAEIWSCHHQVSKQDLATEPHFWQLLRSYGMIYPMTLEFPAILPHLSKIENSTQY